MTKLFNKKVLMGLFLTLVMIVPYTAKAVSIGELQAQIQSLLQIVAQLQQQLAQVTTEGTNNNSVASTTQNIVNIPVVVQPVKPIGKKWWCDKFVDLKPGVRGDRVWKLHEAMGTKILGVAPTGYYGELTKRAWDRFCGTTPVLPTHIGKLSAYPTSGKNPLRVTFYAEAYTGRLADLGYNYIDFGDGTQAEKLICKDTHSPKCIVKVTHIYKKDGKHIATLFTAGYYAPRNDEVYGTRSNVAKVVISVYGDVGTTNPQDNPQCKSWYDGCNNCSRFYPGGPAMCTKRMCVANIWSQKPYCREYFNNTDNNVNIKSFTGPVLLTVGQTGTWKVRASNTKNKPMTYDINWGDEMHILPMVDSISLQKAITQRTTFTHSYSKPGTYTINVTVRTQDGSKAKATTSVFVKDEANPTVCTTQFEPVCGSVYLCNDNTYCFAPAMLKTFGNICELKKAHATFVHSGMCEQMNNPDTAN